MNKRKRIRVFFRSNFYPAYISSKTHTINIPSDNMITIEDGCVVIRDDNKTVAIYKDFISIEII